MTVDRTLRRTAVGVCVLTVGLVSGCSSSGSSPAQDAAKRASAAIASAMKHASAISLPSNVSVPSTVSVPSSGASGGATSTAGQSASGSGGKCSDLTSAQATAAVGKQTTVMLLTTLGGQTVCKVVVAGEADPIQLVVESDDAANQFDNDKAVYNGVSLSGVGDKAFTTLFSMQVLSGPDLIKITGPATAEVNKDYRIPTAIAKGLIGALH